MRSNHLQAGLHETEEPIMWLCYNFNNSSTPVWSSYPGMCNRTCSNRNESNLMESEKINHQTKSNSQKNLATFIKLSLIKRLIIPELLI